MKLDLDKYYIFDCSKNAISPNTNWVPYANKIKEYVTWCEANMGERKDKWLILQKDGGKNKPLIPCRSYNLQAFVAIGILHSDMATMFRLKFNPPMYDEDISYRDAGR